MGWSNAGWRSDQGGWYKNASAAAPFSGPGDSQAFVLWGSVARGYSAAVAATGTRKAFRVVDGSSANAQDILVLPTGLTDVASLNTWIGLHGTAHVTTLYDQVGTNDWTQATNAKMPTITVSAIGGLPSLTFASANAQMLTSGNLSNAFPFTFEVVAERTLNFTTPQEILTVNSPDTELSFQGAATVGMYSSLGPLTDTATDGAGHVLQATFNSISSSLNVDGRTQITGNSGTNGIVAAGISIGAFGTGSFYLDGYISEAGMISGVYNSGVQSNAQARYGL